MRFYIFQCPHSCPPTQNYFLIYYTLKQKCLKKLHFGDEKKPKTAKLNKFKVKERFFEAREFWFWEICAKLQLQKHLSLTIKMENKKNSKIWIAKLFFLCCLPFRIFRRSWIFNRYWSFLALCLELDSFGLLVQPRSIPTSYNTIWGFIAHFESSWDSEIQLFNVVPIFDFSSVSQTRCREISQIYKLLCILEIIWAYFYIGKCLEFPKSKSLRNTG